MRTYRYNLVGGHPVLDFLNTIHDWTAAALVDRLTDFADVLGFAVASGVVTASEARKLRPATEQDDGPSLRPLRELRGVIARVTQATITSTGPSDEDLAHLARTAARAASLARLRPGNRLVTRTLTVDDASTDLVRMRLADAAVALLTSPAMEFVKTCPSCGWFFLDTTRNKSRRWCSMEMCGAPIKARRYYHRKRND